MDKQALRKRKETFSPLRLEASPLVYYYIVGLPTLNHALGNVEHSSNEFQSRGGEEWAVIT